MNTYTTREAVKSVLGLNGSQFNTNIDTHIEAASREVEKLTNRIFIPKTQTSYFRFPQRDNIKSSYVLYLDEDLLSVSALTKNDDSATAIDAADYFLEPSNLGPPYDRIEIDASSAAYFGNALTPQRAVRVTGSWGYSNDTKAAGAVAGSGLASDVAATSFVCSDASRISVGETLLIGTEQLWVSDRGTFDTTAALSAGVTAAANIVTIPITSLGTKVKAGEIVLIDSERMFVEAISGNNLTVKRAYDGSVLAAHAQAAAVYADRTLTVARGVNGTTAAVHADTTAINKYAPPADIQNLCRALSIAYLTQSQGGWTGQIGGAENGIETTLAGLSKLREAVKRQYRRTALAFV
jgi:hypothetical protein